MKRVVFYWLSGFVALIMAIEITLQILPVSSATDLGYHVDSQILTYPPNQEWTTATGWDLRNIQHHRANNVGFLADHDFVFNPQAVALIGDSFVEASMLPPADRPAAQLERLLGNRPVYALGGPGSALLDYAERIRFAIEQYGVRDVVILMERGDVRQSLCGSGNIHAPCLDPKTLAPKLEVRPPPGLAKRTLRHSALAQYLLGQLKIQPGRIWQQVVDQSRPVTHSAVASTAMPTKPVHDTLAAQHAVAEAFFERIEGLIPGKLVIIIDTDRKAIYRGVQPLTQDEARQRFIAMAEDNGAKVVDATSFFQTEFARRGLKFDVGPYDAHMNSLGVFIVMAEAAARLAPN